MTLKPIYQHLFKGIYAHKKPLELLCLENQIVGLNYSLVYHPIFVPKSRSSPQARPKTPVLVVHRGGPGWGQKGWIFGMIFKKQTT
jgi:hypothetical protein